MSATLTYLTKGESVADYHNENVQRVSAQLSCVLFQGLVEYNRILSISS